MALLTPLSNIIEIGTIGTFTQNQKHCLLLVDENFIWLSICCKFKQFYFIGEWEGICNEFQKMLFIRSLRPDRVTFSITHFIVNQLGPQFVEPPVLDIKAVLEESVPQTPLIFVLSPGVDPTPSLIQLAENAKMSSRFQTISLGQGQAPIATR